MAMRSFEAFKRKQLKDPKFKAAYDALEEEFALAAKEIEARKRAEDADKRARKPNKLEPRRSK